MCYDTVSSLTAWTAANIISVVLYARNRNYDRWNAAFITCFTTIQLLEAGVWAGGNDEALVQMMLVALLAQPLVQSGMGYAFTKNDLLLFMTIMYFAMMLWGLWRVAFSKKGDFGALRGPGGHMIWRDSDNKGSTGFLGGGGILGKIIPILYLGGMSIPLLFMKENRGLPLIAIGVSTAVYSMATAGKDEFSTMWCFYSVVYALAALLV